MKEKKDCENFNRVLNVVLNNMKSYERERTLDIGEELDKRISETMTLYCDYTFSINENGLKLVDKERHDKDFNQVKLENTPLNVGDSFVLELDEDSCMFFRRVAHGQG